MLKFYTYLFKRKMVVLQIILLFAISFNCHTSVWASTTNISAGIQSDSDFLLKGDGSLWTINIELSSDEEIQYQLLDMNIKNVGSISTSDRLLILKKDGTVWEFVGSLKEVGKGLNEDVEQLTQVVGLENIIQVYAGDGYSLALKADGKVYGWGFNGSYQISNDSIYEVSSPIVIEGLDNIIEIAAGSFEVLALKKDGTVWNWGENDNIDSATPVKIHGLEDIVKIDIQSEKKIALRKDGVIITWDYYNSLVFTQGISDIKKIIASRRNYYIVKQDGTLLRWFDEYPTVVEGISNVKDISCGSWDERCGFTPEHMVAITEDGTIYQWGWLLTGDGMGTEPQKLINKDNLMIQEEKPSN